MANRLAGSGSAYLRQHADNPVDWYPWGDEAFNLASAEGKPVFLSIGYSSCHWCHVMAHESFEDPAMAELMNRWFVSVKVDREERPDVDEAYMTFVQLFTGRGGWPTSVFLTPDRAPIFGGTYWPREDRGGYQGFRSICERIAEAWTEQRPELELAAAHNAEALREAVQAMPSVLHRVADSGESSLRELVGSGIDSLWTQFDSKRGGFGGAPKFPPHTAIEFLLRASRHEPLDLRQRERATEMAVTTLEKMALGGLHDHVGGGFHRYSTDDRWLLPHFEKMLYDNALLLGNYAKAAIVTGRPLFRRAAEGIAGWLEREMRSPEGLFYSALDADSEGEEGKFYVWSWDELRELPEGEAFARLYQCRPEGNYADEATGRRSGRNILHLAEPPALDHSSQLRALLDKREGRVRPGLDDKAIVSWNGLAIAALVEADRRDLAERSAASILEAEKVAGKLPHLIVNGAPVGDGFLDDYAYFLSGLLALGGEFQAAAERLTTEMVDRFWDPENGGFFSSSTSHEVLFGSAKPVLDQPLPSGNAVAVKVLASLGRSNEALATLDSARHWMERAPHGTEALYTAALEILESPLGTLSPRGRGQGEGYPAEGQAKEGEDYRSTNVVELTIRPTEAGGVVRLAIAPGFHLNSNPAPTAWLIPTEVRFEGVEGTVHYPDGGEGRYAGVVEIPYDVSATQEYEVVVRYQACTDRECLAPQEIRRTVIS